MNKVFRLSALFCAMTLLVTSCTKDVVEEQPAPNPEVDGTEIQFGARAGFETTDDTRTVYSGETYQINGTGPWFERIDWVASDNIDEADWVEIYSPEAKGINPAHYYVTKTTTGKESDGGYLTKLADGGLQWNGEVATHHFYAMYPSSQVVKGISIGKSGDDVIVKAVIGNEQHAQGATTYDANGNVTTDESKIDRYEFAPDMDFAYMVATGESTADKESVTLNFKPIVTAVRVQLELPTSGVDKDGNTVSASPLRLFSVRLSGKGIVGEYTANLSNYDDEGYPTITNGAAADEQHITMLVIGADGLPITLQPGQKMAFTVFVRPGEDINTSDLKVSFSTDGQNYKSKNIETTATIKRLKKTSVLGLKLPYQTAKLSYANWMEQVRDDATILELSLPGTGGSFSYAYNDTNPNWYKQQTLPIFTGEEGYEGKMGQWDLGIRAFEMACDRPQGSTVSNPGSLDSQPIRVNKEDMGDWTIGTALRALLNKVKGSSETAMAIITYQSEGDSSPGFLGWGSYTTTRNAKIFAKSLKALYNTLVAEGYGDQMILYTPETVMYNAEKPEQSAEGKLMIICRINQTGEAESSDSNANTYNTQDKSLTYTENNWKSAKEDFSDIPILLINGCGTAKDRWAARGYSVSADGTSYLPADEMMQNTPNSGSNVEYYMVKNGNSFPTWNVKVAEGGQYSFKTQLTKDDETGQKVWFQEWGRVVNLDYIEEQRGTINGDFYETGDVRWHESYNEKVADAKHTFDLAISKNPSFADYVFINSLCGYLVDPSIRESYRMFSLSENVTNYSWNGGTAGNIYELAWRINSEFGAYVLETISSQGDRGATGVVLMDYVSDDVNDGASNYLPSIIITNNLYSGALKQSTSGGTSDGNDDENTDINKPRGGNDPSGDTGI